MTVKISTAEKIGRYSSKAGRKDAKRQLAKARRRNERRAIRAGRDDVLPKQRRDFLAGWDD